MHAVPQLMDWNIHYSSKKKGKGKMCNVPRASISLILRTTVFVYTLFTLQLGHKTRELFFIATLFKVNAGHGICICIFFYFLCYTVAECLLLGLFYCHSNVK